MLTEESEIKDATVICVNFYAKTKLGFSFFLKRVDFNYLIFKKGDDFLINISAESQNNNISGTIKIRSKVKGVVVSIG